MHRWLVFVAVAAALLFIGCLAGDVLLFHHLSDFSAEVNQDTHYAPNSVDSLTGSAAIHAGLLCILASLLALGAGTAAQYFCGWHSSAYKETNLLRGVCA